MWLHMYLKCQMRVIKLWICVLPIILITTLTVNFGLLNYLHGHQLTVRLTGCDVPNVEYIDNSVALHSVVAEKLNHFDIDPSKLVVMGNRRSSKGYLTIGVPSIRRVNGPAYLLETLASLSEHTSESEKSEVTVVVFLADFDADYNNETVSAITQRHREDLARGFINIIQVSPSHYPQLSELKRNYGDAPDRVQWRAKQVVDFSFLFLFSANTSEYYIQLEDDVRAARGYVRSIRQYVREQSRVFPEWAVLEFSELGFIGKLFRSSELGRLAQFMMTFYMEQPIDWLVRYFKLAMKQPKDFIRKPTVFQHFGVKSSFDVSKDNPLKDRFYDAGDSPLSNADNPPAVVTSTMPHYKEFTPEMAYSSGTGYFWATKAIAGDSLHVVFDSVQNVSRIVVQTGNSDYPSDVLHAGRVYVSQTVTKVTEKYVACDSTQLVASSFNNGVVIIEHLESVLSFPVRCLKVTVEEDHSHWIVFANIAIFLTR